MSEMLPGYLKIKGVHERLDALDKAGLIYHPKKGKWPGLKRYVDADQGNPPQNIILEPTGFTNYNKGDEFLGYQTQKPLGLLITLAKPTAPMAKEAAASGFHTIDAENRKYPKVQIATIENLLSGRPPQLPALRSTVFKKTPRETKEANQKHLL